MRFLTLGARLVLCLAVALCRAADITAVIVSVFDHAHFGAAIPAISHPGLAHHYSSSVFVFAGSFSGCALISALSNGSSPYDPTVGRPSMSLGRGGSIGRPSRAINSD